MASPTGQIRINSGTATVGVTITGEVYSDAAGGSAASFPATISTATTYYVPPGEYTVTVTLNGNTIHTATRRVQGGGDLWTVDPDIDSFSERAAQSGTIEIGEQIPINSLGKPLSHTNWNTKNQSSADWGATEVSSTTAQNNEISYAFTAPAGTYTLSIFHKLGPSRGIYTIYIDDAALGTTVDGYAASITPTGGTTDIDNIVLATGGRHVLKFKMETKNASSTGYLGCLNGVQIFTRTA